jgi:hypothetical protein
MTTARRAAANAQNAEKSTGPRTLEGKSVSRLNALKHGLLSQETLLPEEDEALLTSLRESLQDELRPVGILEDLLEDRMTSVLWRLRRLGTLEAGVLSCRLGKVHANRALKKAKKYEEPDPMEEDVEEEPIVTDAEKHEAAMAKFRKAKARQKQETPTLGLAFIRDSQESDAFSKLSRYETTLERSFFRALHELQSLQAARMRHVINTPQSVDTDGSQDR